MSRALVTGSSGFLGRHLIPVLEKRRWEIDKLDLRNPGFISFQKPDVIFHLAAATQAGDYSLTHAGEQWLENQKLNTFMLDIWKKKYPEAKFITIGSSCAYAPGLNLKEEDYMKGEPHESLYTYAMTKRMLYEGCRALNKQFGMKYLYLVPSTLYGPNYHTDGRQAHFIFDLIRKIMRGKELGEEVRLWGNGLQGREVIYVEDFVNQMIALKDEEGIFNISGHSASITHFAHLVSMIAGYNPHNIIYDTSKHVGAEKKSLNGDKLKGCFELTPLLEGLEKTVLWYYETGSWK